MERLIERLGDRVKGVLTGFDRMVFKGMIRPVSYAEGAMEFLGRRGVLNKDYKQWMREQTRQLIDAVNQCVKKHCGRDIVKMDTWRKEKDKLAKACQAAHGIKEGVIGAWSFQESGRSYRATYDAEAGYPQLQSYPVHCKHLYLYMDHKDYGFMNVRLQTWFPYHIQVCLNGREWLRRSLEHRKVKFVAEGNKFYHVGDYALAQRFLDEQLDSRWPELLDGLLPLCFPTMRQTLGAHLEYYWTLWQGEWATDIVMNSAADLTPLMTSLVRHAMLTDTGTRVLRYMGRPITKEGKPYRTSRNEVTTRLLDFYDGVRLRHWVDQNSLKVYNDHNNLRAEVTMNNPGMFRVHRRAQGEASTAPKKLRPIRKGVADIPLRAKLSKEINNRFMDGLASFSDQTPMRELLREPTRARVKSGRRVRALDPTGKDRLFLEAVADPAFCLSDISNAQLQKRLRDTVWGSGRTEVQLSARISRHLRLLRDHGFIRKVPYRRRYQLTNKGRTFVTALTAMLGASTQQLMEKAA